MSCNKEFGCHAISSHIRTKEGNYHGYLLQDRTFHCTDVLIGEISFTHRTEHLHRNLLIPGTVELAGHVQRCDRHKLEGLLVDQALADIAVQVVQGYGDDFAIEVKVVDDLVGPLADLGAPVFVDAGSRGGGAGGDADGVVTGY